MSKDSFLTFVNNFKEETQNKIIELAKTELQNEEKKKKLDVAIVDFVLGALDKMSLSGLAKLLIKKFVLPHVAELTQLIFDLLKEKFESKAKKDESGKDATKGKDTKNSGGKQE